MSLSLTFIFQTNKRYKAKTGVLSIKITIKPQNYCYFNIDQSRKPKKVIKKIPIVLVLEPTVWYTVNVEKKNIVFFKYLNILLAKDLIKSINKSNKIR